MGLGWRGVSIRVQNHKMDENLAFISQVQVAPFLDYKHPSMEDGWVQGGGNSNYWLEVPSIVYTNPWGMNGSRVEGILITLLKFPQYVYTSMRMNKFRVQGASITRVKFPLLSSKQAFGHNYHSYYSHRNEPTPNNAP